MLRLLTAGESHGQALVVVLEGLPAGLEITVEDIQAEMARRRLGYGRGPRQRFEVDELTLLGGVRHGRTLGSPLAIEIRNTEWFRSDRWHDEMSPAPGETKEPLTQVRPGHADLAGMQKYGFTDARDVLERASARETAARVAAGAVAKRLLSHLGVEIISHVIQMGSARVPAEAARPMPADLDAVDESPVRCFDNVAADAMIAEVKAAAKDGDSLGGVVEVLAFGVPIGLGSHVHWDRKLDGLVAQALMS
ncbi:MAG: chorismate synthase, partial [Ilumatobacteraceae bacterium]